MKQVQDSSSAMALGASQCVLMKIEHVSLTPISRIFVNNLKRFLKELIITFRTGRVGHSTASWKEQ